MSLFASTDKDIRRPSRWLVAAAVVLAVLYAAPHLWWMIGFPAGFPGERGEFDTAFQRTWFAVYNLLTTAFILAGAVLVVAVEYDRVIGRVRRVAWYLVLAGAVLLLLRGFLGLITSIPPVLASGSDVSGWALAWEAWFLATGAVYAFVARRNR